MKSFVVILFLFSFFFYSNGQVTDGSLDTIFDFILHQCNLSALHSCYDSIIQGAVPTCAPNVFPTFSSCCISCLPLIRRPIFCKTDPSTLPICASGVTPYLNTTDGCPTCRYPFGLSQNCNASQLEACENSYSTLPSCPRGVLPVRTSDCCLSCKFVPFCTKTQLINCATSLPNLPVCASAAEATFNTTSCCRSCRPPLPSPPSGNGTCSLADMMLCLAATPVCEIFEDAIADTDRTFACCPSCRRPETLCTIEQSVRCRLLQPHCNATAGERPLTLINECCPSCRYAPPVCNPGCTSSQVCVRDLAGSPICVTRLDIDVVLVKLSILNGVTLDSIIFRELLHEILDRFCDQNAVAPLCRRFRTAIYNIDAAFDIVDKVIDIILGIADGVKRSSSSDLTTLVQGALSDSYASNGITLSPNSMTGSMTGSPSQTTGSSSQTTGSSQTNSASTLFISIFSFAAIFLSLLI